MRLLISEILQKVSNAKTKAEKINLLRQHSTPALRALLIWNFDESVVNALPPGAPPYRPNEAPPGTEHTTLEHESRLFYHFLKGGNDNLGQTRREQMFIQMLEGLQQSEAEVLIATKERQLHKKYKLTFATVKEAFPEITWGGRGG